MTAYRIVAGLVVLFALETALRAETKSPFDEALHIWTFADENDSKDGLKLKIHGDVQLGVAEPGPKWSDGKVARFNGGYLSIGDNGVIPLTGRQWTIFVRARDPKGQWLGPLFGSYGSEKEVSFALRGVDGKTLPMEDRNNSGSVNNSIESWMFATPGGPREIKGSSAELEFKWGADHPSEDMYRKMRFALKGAGLDDLHGFPLENDVLNGVLSVAFPLQVLGLNDWHDIVVRCLDAKFQLFVDGVLLDEEFPIGDLRPSTIPCLFGARMVDGKVEGGFKGEMDEVAVWNRPLTDQEIADLSGGEQAVAAKQKVYLGEFPATAFQYYRPRSHNMKAGDCVPFFQDGRLHIFNCVVRRPHSKWYGGSGAIELHHYSTADMKTWKEHPLVAPITEQWEAWNGTGQAVVKDGKWYLFYPCPSDVNKQPYAGIQLAISSDGGETWEKQTPHPFLTGGDCHVSLIPGTDEYEMLYSGPLLPPSLPKLNDRTLVAWADPNDATLAGGAVISLIADKGKIYQAISHDKDGWRIETTYKGRRKSTSIPATKGLQQLALVTSGSTLTLYVNGTKASEFAVDGSTEIPLKAQLLLGLTSELEDDAPTNYFTGSIADARLYASALTPEQLAALKPGQESDPKPLVWYDFATGKTDDKGGTVPFTEQIGDPKLQNGLLVLDGYSYLTAGSAMKTIARRTSTDLLHWTDQPDKFLIGEESTALTTCPHLFQWRDWWYYFGGHSLWRSKSRTGPWVRAASAKIDPVSVPKTGPIPGPGDRRFMVGFIPDGSWGGNLAFRELTQNPDGSLGSKWIPEMTPATGKALPVKLTPVGDSKVKEGTAIAAGGKERGSVDLADVPTNCLLSFKVVPGVGVTQYGLRVRTDDKGSESCDLAFIPDKRTVKFDCISDSHLVKRSGVAYATAVTGLDKPITVNVMFYHDLIDVEIDGRRTDIVRFWKPGGTHLQFWSEGGSSEFSDITLKPLLEQPPTFPPGANQQITSKP